jgi:hypothetical protein
VSGLRGEVNPITVNFESIDRSRGSVRRQSID